MAKVYIYDGETGKFKREQEPMLDPLETQAQGHNVYFTYPNSTELVPPETGEREAAFFVDGAWVVKGQFKNVEVYNKVNKNFEICNTDELNVNQVFIDDEAGIAKFKQNSRQWMVDEETWTIVENPLYPYMVQLDELYAQFNAADTTYETALDTPVEFPVNHHLYKAKWIDDGTYTKVITGKLAGLITFPIEIWDATKLEENMVSMDETTFGQLVAFLTQVQVTAFNTRKYAQAALLPQIKELEDLINPPSEVEVEEE